MIRKGTALVLAGAMVVALTVARTEPLAAVVAVSAETRLSEIGDEQYALLASPETFPKERLEEVRQRLTDDGRISYAEFDSLGMRPAVATNSKRALLERLDPQPAAGVFLHPGEPNNPAEFAAAVCNVQPPRTETPPVTVGESTYQLREFHFCGSQRISGFSVYRDGVRVNSVRHFGHGSAEVFLNGDNACLFRRDLTSQEAYRLLEAFYDGGMNGDEFLRAVIKAS